MLVLEAKFTNDEYAAAGVNIKSPKDVYNSDIMFKVRAPEMSEVASYKDGSTLFSFLYPAQNTELVDALAKKKMTAFAMDCVPRISRGTGI